MSKPKQWRAPKRVKQVARDLRRNQTHAEQRLWKAVRYGQIEGLRFRRQHPVGRFIADFCCIEKRLIIEVDGEVHRYTEEYDQVRQEYLESQDYQILRFTNRDIMSNLEGVVEAIRLIVS